MYIAKVKVMANLRRDSVDGDCRADRERGDEFA